MKLNLNNLDWSTTKSNPCNNTLCILETTEGKYLLAMQHCGEWYDWLFPNSEDFVEVKRWAFFKRKWVKEIFELWCK